MNAMSPEAYNLLIDRMLNSVTGYLILKVQTACSFVETCMQPDSPPDLEGSDSLFPLWRLVYSLTPLLPPWSGFLRATERLSPGVRVLNVPTKKITLYLQLVTVIFS